jgi:excisionase family DNA binding protein
MTKAERKAYKQQISGNSKSGSISSCVIVSAVTSRRSSATSTRGLRSLCAKKRRNDMLNNNDLSTAEAASIVGVDKASIARAIKAGKISADKNEFGDYRIRRSELARYRPRHAARQQRPVNIEQRFARVRSMLSAAMDELSQLEAMMCCSK